VPFPPVAYAEDHALSLAMLRAGHAKVYVPAAGVLHSHDYTLRQQFSRAFDDWRGLLEVYGWREPANARHWTLQLRGRLAAEWRALRASGTPLRQRPVPLCAAGIEHLARLSGAVLGSRSDHLPRWARRAASLEARTTFLPADHAIRGAGGAGPRTSSAADDS
jgi:rhamnosyltransferase